MSSLAQFWTLTIVLAIGTWLMRSLPIMLHGHVAHPPWLERLLKHVPVAALTALVAPGVIYLHEGARYSVSVTRIAAGVLALIVALKTKNVFATVVIGMAALWLGQWILAPL